MEFQKDNIATSAGHWYAKDGAPCYTIVGANGKERNTTLRDARKHGYLPSVTAINNIKANPGLQKWKMDNLLMAALTLPKIEGETLEDFAKRIEVDANDQATKARDLGTEIHGSLERAYLGQSYPLIHTPHVSSTMNAISEHFGEQEWSAEKSFASPLGYGGKIDLSSKNIVIDFKTSAFSDAAKKEGYDEYIMQLVAYAYGLGMNPGEFRTANVLVSTSVPGLVKIIEYTQEEMDTAWEKFKCLLRFWQLDKQYFPGE